MENSRGIALYFGGWIFLAIVAAILNGLNINWTVTPIWQGVLLLLLLSILQGSVLEFVVLTITALFTSKKRIDSKAVYDNLTLVLNYNLLALAKEDIDETYQRMYDAFIGNLSPNISAVLVSATNDPALKLYEIEQRDNYRAQIHHLLYQEGLAYGSGDLKSIDPFRLHHVWSKFSHLDRRSFVQERLNDICDTYSKDFMCIHRVSRVLRKCGQYQDLMLLSKGDLRAYTYTDNDLYGKKSRDMNELLFYHSDDVENVLGRNYNYTLVLDGDTRVPPGAVHELLAIAAANPESAILQPAIKLEVNDDDTIFMHLERLRQKLNEPVTDAVSNLLGQCGYFGKALIKNSLYIENVIGLRDNLIERVPIDVLSHDTFEAAVLKPYYASSVFLYEAPSFNYVTWNIRERRWNRGEVILSMYFWQYVVGYPMRFLQKIFQGDSFVKTKLRTQSKLDFVSSYIAHSALRQMFMKPALLLCIVLYINVTLYHPYVPIGVIMFLVIIFPKFAIITCRNAHLVFLETIASIMQFTPEAVVGCVRIFKAYQANICKTCNWKPQRAVEEEFKNSNPMLSSIKHLWGYSLLAAIAIVLVTVFTPMSSLIYFMLSTLFILPIYTGLTSFTLRLKSSSAMANYRDNIGRSTASLGSVSIENISNPRNSLV